jgi:type I restriction enzyme, S subunit
MSFPKYPRYKDSGVHWLGEVPGHWEVRRVRNLSSFVTSGPRGWSERISEVGAKFIQSGDLTDDLSIAFDEAKRVAVDADAEAVRTKLTNGDVVVCITGAKTGNVAVCATVPEDAYVNQHLCLIRPRAEILPELLAVYLKSDAGQRYFAVAQYGLKQGMSLENIKEATVPVPPIYEQRKILEVTHRVTASIGALVRETRTAITLLQERRTALISAAVTGQIDVRGLLPDEKNTPPFPKNNQVG